MSEQKIENHIIEVLPGDAKKLALDFVTYLRAQEMQLERGTGYWEDKRYWMIKYKGEYVCFILVNGYHGYEMWVTIPDNIDVPEPLVKKYFEGGLYAAHMIPMGAFEEWDWLFKWTHGNEKYEYRGTGDGSNMFGCLEENLNYINNVTTFTDGRYDNVQLDLLMPIKAKEAKG